MVESLDMRGVHRFALKPSGTERHAAALRPLRTSTALQAVAKAAFLAAPVCLITLMCQYTAQVVLHDAISIMPACQHACQHECANLLLAQSQVVLPTV